MRLAKPPDPIRDQVCFHCQQLVEKYLKALLEELGQPIPKVHDLEELLFRLKPYHPSLSSHNRGLKFLTLFAVAARYPDFSITARRTEAALRWAERIRLKCRDLLAVP
jgi:HEPN domain-containing protein